MNKAPQMIFYALICIVLSCSSKTYNNNPSNDKDSDYNDFDITKYNLEIRPDTTISWYPIIGLETNNTITNKIMAVQKSLGQLILISKEDIMPFWPANLPSFINIGDTIIASGKLYSIPRSERMPGYPLVITKIYIQTSYRNKN